MIKMDLQFFGGRGAKSGKKTSAPTIRTGALNDEEIEKLESAGGRRWRMYGKDRIYFNAEQLGLKVERYNSGNIAYAELNGEKISNSKASSIATMSLYVDVKTGERSYGSKNGYRDSKWGRYAKDLNENFNKIVDKARRE